MATEAADKPRHAWPIFRSLASFRPSDLPGDLIAGLTLAAIAIPEQMATARLGGFSPQTGFFASSRDRSALPCSAATASRPAAPIPRSRRQSRTGLVDRARAFDRGQGRWRRCADALAQRDGLEAGNARSRGPLARSRIEVAGQKPRFRRHRAARGYPQSHHRDAPELGSVEIRLEWMTVPKKFSMRGSRKLFGDT
jgi:hypothetical protein